MVGARPLTLEGYPTFWADNSAVPMHYDPGTRPAA